MLPMSSGFQRTTDAVYHTSARWNSFRNFMISMKMACSFEEARTLLQWASNRDLRTAARLVANRGSFGIPERSDHKITSFNKPSEGTQIEFVSGYLSSFERLFSNSKLSGRKAFFGETPSVSRTLGVWNLKSRNSESRITKKWLLQTLERFSSRELRQGNTLMTLSLLESYLKREYSMLVFDAQRCSMRSNRFALLNAHGLGLFRWRNE